MNTTKHIMSIEEYESFLNESELNEGLLDRFAGFFGKDKTKWKKAFANFKPSGTESKDFKKDKKTIEDAVIEKDKSLKGFFWAKSKSNSDTKNAIEGLTGYVLTYYNQVALQAQNAKLNDVKDFIDEKSAKEKPQDGEEGIEKQSAVFKFQDANATKAINVYKNKIAQAVSDNKDLQKWANTLMGDLELIAIDVVTKNANLCNFADSPEAAAAYEKMQKQRQEMFDLQAQQATANMEKEIKELNSTVEKLNQELGAQSATTTLGKILDLSDKSGAEILTDKEFSKFQAQLKKNAGQNGYVDTDTVNKTIEEVFKLFESMFSKFDKKTEVSLTSIIGAINALGFAKATKDKKKWIYEPANLNGLVDFINDTKISADKKSFIATSLFPILEGLKKENPFLEQGDIYKAVEKFAKEHPATEA